MRHCPAFVEINRFKWISVSRINQANLDGRFELLCSQAVDFKPIYSRGSAIKPTSFNPGYLVPVRKPKKLECQVVIKFKLVGAGFEPMTSFRVQTKKLKQQGLGFGLLLRAGIQWFEAKSFSRERLPA